MHEYGRCVVHVRGRVHLIYRLHRRCTGLDLVVPIIGYSFDVGVGVVWQRALTWLHEAMGQHTYLWSFWVLEHA